MKFLLIIFFISSVNIKMYCQIQSFNDFPDEIILHFDSIGIDSDLLLNHYESIYLNFVFEKQHDNFEFNNKKVGFITGSSGNTISSKKQYFDSDKDRYRRNSSPNIGELYIFDENQKIKSGGYDACILYWSKFSLTSEEIIKRINKIKAKKK